MIPKSFSASALLTAESCLARYKAESLDRTPSMDNPAAATGTSVHWALENFVKGVYLEKKYEWSDRKLLLDLYQLGYMETFKSAELDTPEYQDGLELVEKWYDRTEIKDTVVSCEVKESFMIPTSVGEIPLNYIWDRCDQLNEETYRVVDYKTIRANLSPDQLKKKIQPRVYALAAQIKWNHATRIWVTFDLIRHDAVGAVFTREDNAATWRYLKRAAERIIAADPESVPETLNPECHFCIRKPACSTLKRAADAGTIFGVSPDEAARRKLEISSQIKALTYLDKELDSILLAESEHREEYNWATADVKVDITASRRRGVNSPAVAKIIGPELAARYNGFTMANIDKLLKGTEIDEFQKIELREEITMKFGEPTAKVSPLDPIEEE